MWWTLRPSCGEAAQISTSAQGVVILGTPLGHADFVRGYLEGKSDSHGTLLARIPAVQDLQAAWVILLFCASARANFLLRALPPQAAYEFSLLVRSWSMQGLQLQFCQRSFHVLSHCQAHDFRRADLPYSPRSTRLLWPPPCSMCCGGGVLASRGFVLESAAAHVCRQASGRVTTNCRIQDRDIVTPNQLDECL